MNFMLIRRFFMYFADFRANFAFFDDCFVLLAQMGIERPLLLEQTFDNIWLQFCEYESFFVEKYCKIWRKLELFLIVCSFS